MKLIKNIVFILVLAFCFVGCEYITEVADISEKTVVGLAPKSNTIVTDRDVVFSWNPVADAENYKLQIATPNFENASQIVTDSTMSVLSFTKTLSSGNYEWRVRAENSEYATAYTVHEFILTESPPKDISNQVIALTAPTNNATFSTTDPVNFSWETVEDADSYVFQIAIPDFDNPTEVIEDKIITETSFSKSNFEVGDYEWRVKAKNSIYETAYTTQSFKVQ
ncbi:hypothetical protein Q4Q34_07785 [Flavivirga abyssicola]|uniref:hypothetical protein n=1 Tax=Flavivirga abyssicola TaxID=3063533 RepID=UPI0026E0BA96|nr:hypothetical protein [Flavivirga sp. MEBiC07777]WVK14926.1 hypothetical protein Q4Q34_07785 [Flavivirga sp. MEBiC07777]